MWRLPVAASVVVMAAGLLTNLQGNTAHACSGDPGPPLVSEADRVSTASIIVSGRFSGYRVVADEPTARARPEYSPDGLKTSSLIRLPVRLDLDVTGVIKGDVESGRIAIARETWLTRTAPERDEYEWLVASGGCGFFSKNDPSGKYVVLSLSQKDSGSYQITHLFFGGDDPGDQATAADRIGSLPAAGPGSRLPLDLLILGVAAAGAALAVTSLALLVRSRRSN